METMKDSPCSRPSKSQFVFRLEHEFRRVLYETEQGFITTTQTKFGYQHLFHYGLAILIDVLLAHPRYIPHAVRRRYESQVHGHFDDILKRMGANAFYGRPIGNRRFQRRNIAGGARRLREAIDAYSCAEDDCSHVRFAITYSHLLRLARREVASRVYVCIGQRLPAELCDVVVDAAYQAEGIEQDPALVRKAGHCPKLKEDHELNWEPSLGRYRNNLEFDEDFLTSGPADSEQSYDSDDLSPAASSEESETSGNHDACDESDVEGDDDVSIEDTMYIA
jgi:hypothetical protein